MTDAKQMTAEQLNKVIQDLASDGHVISAMLLNQHIATIEQERYALKARVSLMESVVDEANRIPWKDQTPAMDEALKALAAELQSEIVQLRNDADPCTEFVRQLDESLDRFKTEIVARLARDFDLEDEEDYS